MTTLSFTVTFHSPFRVGSAYARDGIDAALDRHDPLPPDHLKGLMRAACADQLGVPADVVGAIFGSTSQPSPWSWTAAETTENWDFTFRHRVTIDGDSHSALKDHLVLGEQAWTEHARFEISQSGAVGAEELDRHVLILRCAAAAVHGLGSWRRRGLGWAGITPDDGPVSERDVEALLNLIGAGR